ncbi:threonine synthase [Christiangramia flava]|uniref:Threonine synthase n=1 Tax=Christiangramia flava JLT2011 TaxID=1229726 RepID=A0A1L7I0Q7_9FLAO|nr:threonine synthase [Christiangramia flava]APU66784.1 Threonine synthase [Christiangramia flava JLT2011]OSS38421.1 Threonine synthase [Christiangramia flava JLT2011]
MRYFSLNNHQHFSNFENAVVRGLAPDKGLYFPEKIEKLPASFFEELPKLTNLEIGYQSIRQFVGDEIPEEDLKKIISKTLDFEFPVVPVENGISSLELFHGPTLAFKDVGARFMAGCLGYFSQKSNLGNITVLVATSGDTGGAVANGFLGVEGVEVVILYPKGKVSDLQEKQLTTLGQNITALEVDGVFDDCQAMVKQAFLDETITTHRKLTSANSINVARWLPQMFYYFIAAKQIQEKPVFAVPSGNFGNICAGLMARELGLPVAHFVAANNVNNTVVDFMDSGKYQPKPSTATISNAMDVGDPSNFVRILQLFGNEHQALKKDFSAYSFSDEDTRKTIREVFQKENYILDPHGAVGYLGLQQYLKETASEAPGIFLETAHPVKFLDTVEEEIQTKVPVPESVRSLFDKKKKSLQISSKYEDLKRFLLDEN